jgi:hypothetical protein
VTPGEMVKALRAGLGRRSGLVPVPAWPIGAALRATGRGDLWDRLGGELRVSPAKLMQAGWKPRVGTAEGLAAMAAAWKAS